MRYMGKSRARVRNILLALILLGAANAQAELNIRLLTDCQMVSDAVRNTRTLTKGGASCRPAADTFERAIELEFRHRHLDACFQPAPAKRLQSFSCFQVKGVPELVCMKAADADDIQLYKQNYHTQYAARQREALATAAACPASNGDVSPSPPILPLAAALFARLEVAFSMPIGQGKITPDRIMHGFAMVAPKMASDLGDAVEIVVITLDGKMPEYQGRTVEGKINVVIDENADFNTAINQTLRNDTSSALPTVRIASRELAFRKPGKMAAPDLDDINASIGRLLRIEGFVRMSDARIRREAGISPAELLKRFRAQVPYGWQTVMGERNHKLTFWMNDKEAVCTRHGRGAVGLGLITTAGDTADLTDGGQVAVMVIAMGTCAQKTASNSTYIKELQELVQNAVVNLINE